MDLQSMKTQMYDIVRLETVMMCDAWLITCELLPILLAAWLGDITVAPALLEHSLGLKQEVFTILTLTKNKENA